MRDLLVITLVLGLVPFILARAWIGVLAWAWIGLMNPHQLGWGAATTFPAAMIIGGATLISLVFAPDKKAPPMNVAMVCILLMAIFYTLKLPFAWLQAFAPAQWVKVMKILLMTFVTGALIYGEQRIKWLLWTIIFSIGFYGFKGGLFSLLTGGQHQVLGPQTTFIAGNTEIGLVMIMVLPLILVAAQQAKQKWLRLLCYATFWLSIPAIVFTYSRGALIGLAVTFFFVFFKMRRKPLVVLMLVPVLIAGVAFTPEKLFDRAETIKEYEEDDSAMQRLQAWSVAKNIALRHPLAGAGFELERLESPIWLTYADFMGRWENRTKAAHSIYFQILGEHGFVGLILFLAMLVGTLATLSRARRQLKAIPEAQWLSAYAGAMQIGMYGYMVTGAFLSLAYFDLLYTYVVLAAIIGREAAARHAATLKSAPPRYNYSPVALGEPAATRQAAS